MELQISETREELLLNTINHFNVNNRSFNVDRNGKTCSLINKETGYRCAIGRELTEEVAIDLDCNHGGSIFNAYDELPERLRLMGYDFLEEVQTLHDVEKFWDENGLTENGCTQARYIISYYNLDLEL